MIRLTILMDNRAGRSGLLAEHGLSIAIDAGGERILFDTGQGLDSALEANARELGVPLDRVSHIALSHGHYDHAGGLRRVLGLSKGARVWTHPDALRPKYAGAPGQPGRSIGAGITAEEIERMGSKLLWTSAPVEVGAGVFLTGPIPRRTPFEGPGSRFFLDESSRRPDPLTDDQALFVDTADGVVVVLGCAHAGVVNTLHHVRDLAGDRPIAAVLGGMHLGGASDERLSRTCQELREFGVASLGPMHCTGFASSAVLYQSFREGWLDCSAGTRLRFREP